MRRFWCWCHGGHELEATIWMDDFRMLLTCRCCPYRRKIKIVDWKVLRQLAGVR